MIHIIQHFLKENTYIFIHDYAKFLSDSEKFRVLNSVFYKPNRTYGALNLSFICTEDITFKNPIKVTHSQLVKNIQVFKYLFQIKVETIVLRNNEYRPSPINFEVNICELLESGKFDAKGIVSQSDVKNCPIKKVYFLFIRPFLIFFGNYLLYCFQNVKHTLNNVAPTTEGWPPHLPSGKYKLKLNIKLKDVVVAVLEWMLSIVDKKNI